MKIPVLPPSALILLFVGLLCPATSGRAGNVTVIANVPYIINSPGKYVLGSDLKFSAESPKTAVAVQARNVVIDLDGYTLSGPGPNPNVTLTGISTILTPGNTVIRNGTISGFTLAIDAFGSQTRIENLRIIGNQYGVQIGGTNSAVTNCFIVGIGRSKFGLGISVNVSDTLLNGNQVSECYYGIQGNRPHFGILHNFLANSTYGMQLVPTDAYQGNVVVNCGTAFSGGKPVGQENGGN